MPSDELYVIDLDGGDGRDAARATDAPTSRDIGDTMLASIEAVVTMLVTNGAADFVPPNLTRLKSRTRSQFVQAGCQRASGTTAAGTLN